MGLNDEDLLGSAASLPADSQQVPKRRGRTRQFPVPVHSVVRDLLRKAIISSFLYCYLIYMHYGDMNHRLNAWHRARRRDPHRHETSVSASRLTCALVKSDSGLVSKREMRRPRPRES